MAQVHPRWIHRGCSVLGAAGALLALELVADARLEAWVVSLLGVAAVLGVLDRGLARLGEPGRPRALGPADRVTLTRAVLACVVAGLVAQSLRAPLSAAEHAALIGLATVALVLDLVDGAVARRTGSASSLGARFDMETDAALVLVLSVFLVPSLGWWVLAIGLARYLLWAAQRAWRTLRGPVPPRRWRKLVAAAQGLALLLAAADVLPDAWAGRVVGVALMLLAVSFGTEVAERCGRPLTRTGALSALAVSLVWVSLVVPGPPAEPSLWWLVRIPVEALVLVVVGLLAPRRVAVAAGGVFGLLAGVLVLVRVLDGGFHHVLDRGFDPITDWSALGAAVGVLGASVGRGTAVLAVVLVGLAALSVLVALPWAGARTVGVVRRHRPAAARTTAAIGAVAVVALALGLQPPAVVGSAALAVNEVHDVRVQLRDRSVFAEQIGRDPWAGMPADRLLNGLRDRDVLLVFVESYGRVAVHGSSFAPGVRAVLDDGTRRLRAAGYEARSAFLTSPAFGAGSWLAHASVQSGLWVDSQRRYDQLLGARRLTLTAAFRAAGWRTVVDVPANTRDWPEGAAFYGFDAVYDARNVGYRGPAFGYASMPDQYTLSRFDELELRPVDRAPVMAEIDLVSSHHPWVPLPPVVPWRDVGDGSVYDGAPERGDTAAEVFSDPALVRTAYGRSIEYALDTVVSFLTTRDRDLVVVLLGDHQPHHSVSGADPGYDVPVTIIARDPRVLDRVAGWRWDPGLRPSREAPVWRMDAFRDRFLTAFSRGDGEPLNRTGADVVLPRGAAPPVSGAGRPLHEGRTR